jgi:hypothetical protein
MKAIEFSEPLKDLLLLANGNTILDIQLSVYVDRDAEVDQTEFDGISMNVSAVGKVVITVGKDQVSVDLSHDAPLFANEPNEFGYFKIVDAAEVPSAALLLGKKIDNITVLTDFHQLIAGICFEVAGEKFSITNQGDCLKLLNFIPNDLNVLHIRDFH